MPRCSCAHPYGYARAERHEGPRAGGPVTASSDVGTPTVRAFASLAYLPVVRLRAQQNPTFAFGSDMGLSVAPRRSPVTVSLSYRIERFRFSSATGRSEQFEALSLSAGV